MKQCVSDAWAGRMGSGKKQLSVEALCRRLRTALAAGMVTKDILIHQERWPGPHPALPCTWELRAIGGEKTRLAPHRHPGNCSQTAASKSRTQFPSLDLVLVESGATICGPASAPKLVDSDHVNRLARWRQNRPRKASWALPLRTCC